MKKNVIIVSLFFVLLCYANAALSDCMDLSRATNWYAQDSRMIIYYVRNGPADKIVLQDCDVSSSSNVRPVCA